MAPPFFATAGRGKNSFWVGGKGPRVIVWDSLSQEERRTCLTTLQREEDWVVWCTAGEKTWTDRPLTVRGVEIFNSKRVEEKLKKATWKQRTESEGQPDEAPKLRGKGCKRRNWWKEGRVERTQGQRHMACWVHSRGTGNAVPLSVIQELEQEWMRPDEKDDLGLQMCGPERDFWLGTEAGLLGCYEFRGQCAGGDGSEHKGDMGAGCCIRGHKQSELGLEWRLFGPRPPSEGRERCDAQLKEILRSKSVLTVDEWRQLDVSDLELTDYVNVEGLFFQPAGFPGLKCSIKVGRNIEGATSNRAELAAMAEVLRQADKDRDLLYLGDSEAAVTKVQQWIGEGGRRTLTGYPEADILKAVVELLHARVQANSYTAFVKVRAHRGEPLNETADSLAEVGRSAERAQWDERTERFVFSCTTAGQGRRSRTWSAGIRNTIREQAARVCVRHALKASADGWRKEHIDSCRRREEICEEACARAGEGFEMDGKEYYVFEDKLEI